MQERLKRVLIKYSIVLLCGVIYLLINLIFKFSVPCPIKLLFGVDCPACGVTRMIVSAVKLDFKLAFSLNQFLFISFPLIIFCIVYSEVNYVKTGTPSLGRLNFLVYLLIIGAIIFGILRNII